MMKTCYNVSRSWIVLRLGIFQRWRFIGNLVMTGPPYTRGDSVTAIVFPLKSSVMCSCLYVFDEQNRELIQQKLDTWTHIVMPASVELSNYYFHHTSSFCCINTRLLLLTADDWWPG